MRQAIEISLKEKLPHIFMGSDWHFIPHRLENGFFIETNLNFEQLNKEFRKTWSVETSPLTPALFLADILEASAGLHFASLYESDLVTTPLSSEIMRLKLQRIIESRVGNITEIDLFQKATIGKGNTIREAINSGERSFDDFLDLLDHATRFKAWVSKLDADRSLVQDYYSEIIAGTWAERLPAKAFRFLLFTGAGVILDLSIPTGFGTVAGIALGASDAFLIDKIAKGWTPNQFVDGPFKKFVT